MSLNDSDHKGDGSKAVELVYALALSYSTSFNTVGGAVVFGLFSFLLLLDLSRILLSALVSSESSLFSHRPHWGMLLPASD